MTHALPPADAFATVAVRVPGTTELAFDLFTREIDLWWRRGPKFRHANSASSRLCMEPRQGGRFVEFWRHDELEREFELGRVIVWQPPDRLVFSWRNATFSPLEQTEVEVTFAPAGEGTLVTVRHRGWESLRPDHPARHGMADAELARAVGLWWGDQLTALRERRSAPRPPG